MQPKNITTSSNQNKYGKRKRSLESSSSIVYTGSSSASNKDKKFNSSTGKSPYLNWSLDAYLAK